MAHLHYFCGTITINPEINSELFGIYMSEFKDSCNDDICQVGRSVYDYLTKELQHTVQSLWCGSYQCVLEESCIYSHEYYGMGPYEENLQKIISFLSDKGHSFEGRIFYTGESGGYACLSVNDNKKVICQYDFMNKNKKNGLLINDISPKYYKHKYGGIYCLLTDAKNKTNDDTMVIYEHVYPFEKAIYTRNKEEFFNSNELLSEEELKKELLKPRDEFQQEIASFKGVMAKRKISPLH